MNHKWLYIMQFQLPIKPLYDSFEYPGYVSLQAFPSMWMNNNGHQLCKKSEISKAVLNNRDSYPIMNAHYRDRCLFPCVYYAHYCGSPVIPSMSRT